MERIEVPGGHVVGRAVGDGPAILFIHGSLTASAWDALLLEPALAPFRLITWQRRGYGGSSAAPEGFTMADQAADAAAVLAQAGVGAAHVVGHSFGGRVALRLFADRPDLVASVALLESGGPPVAADEPFVAVIEAAVAHHTQGDDATAIDGFLRFLGGEDYRLRCDRALPAGWFEQVVGDAHSFFDVELPVRSALTIDTARAIDRPVFNVVGARSPQFFQDAFAWLNTHLAQVTALRLPDATHLLQLDNPTALAAALARFVADHTGTVGRP